MSKIKIFISKFYQFLTLSDLRIFLVFLLINFIVWRLHFYFPFWDEWEFIDEFNSGHFNFFIPHVEHFKPLFKLFYYLELKYLDERFLYYNYILIFIHSFVGIVFFKILRNLINSKNIAILFSLIFLFNPFHGQTIFSNFQVCSVLNVLFFLIALLFLQKFLIDKKKINIFASFFFSFIQTYFFGQGLLLPLVLIVYYLIFNDKRISYKYIIGYVSVFIVDILIYIHFALNNSTATTNGLFITDIYAILKYFIFAVLINFVKNLALFTVAWPVWILVFVLFSACIFFTYKLKLKDFNKISIFCFLFYSVTFVLLSVSRFRYSMAQSIAGRYTYYNLLPICIYVAYLTYHLFNNYKIKTVKLLFVAYFIFYFAYSMVLINTVKIDREKSYISNYINIVNLAYNPDFEAYTPDLHPFRTPENVKDVYLKFLNKDLKGDFNFKLMEKLKNEKYYEKLSK
ncbi:hypothetical protein A2272_00480 [Candidatus Peregrinibacteria bacterium RIFOXYA12_FULL_33_12]|nr:MAG: hypothetical protein A2272_00480 [Candidatus Peregrinibacteria bacterium RIFOXYA12_FULL_33_12]